MTFPASLSEWLRYGPWVKKDTDELDIAIARKKYEPFTFSYSRLRHPIFWLILAPDSELLTLNYGINYSFNEYLIKRNVLLDRLEFLLDSYDFYRTASDVDNAYFFKAYALASYGKNYNDAEVSAAIEKFPNIYAIWKEYHRKIKLACGI